MALSEMCGKIESDKQFCRPYVAKYLIKSRYIMIYLRCQNMSVATLNSTRLVNNYGNLLGYSNFAANVKSFRYK